MNFDMMAETRFIPVKFDGKQILGILFAIRKDAGLEAPWKVLEDLKEITEKILYETLLSQGLILPGTTFGSPKVSDRWAEYFSC
jgi:hypothetical protein